MILHRSIAMVCIAFAGPALAATPMQAVSLSPAPGVTIAVPKGWISCDASITAQLGGAQDIPGLAGVMCGSPPVHDGKFRVYNPVADRMVSLVVTHSPERAFGTDLSTLAPADLQKKLCDSQTAPMIAHGMTITGCQAKRVSLAGHEATETMLSAGLSGGASAQRILELDYGGGHLQIEFKWLDRSTAATRPIVDALIQSITIP